MYIPLFNRSNYMLLSSMLKIDDILSFAKDSNISSIAICDNNLFGTMEFIKKCEKENIKAIIGLEVNLEQYEIILYAKNYEGYKNLIKLATIQSERKVELDDIKHLNKNVIAIIKYKDRNMYEELSNIYEDIYLGFTNKKEEQEVRITTKNIIFFRENLYTERSEKEYLEYLYRIRDGKTLLDEIDYDIENHELKIENISFFSSEEGINNTFKIAELCNLTFPSMPILLPIYDCEDPKKYLFELCKVGLNKRLSGNIPKEYQERLIYELKVIEEMGFSNYFLVVYDFIRFAKKNKILVGPGRGSAAGSLVAYTLGITDIDPLQYDLLFERFLNPARKTMPDIDTDFPDDKRDIVIEYVKNKYGEKRVSGIITFGTLATKQVIRDTARVLNIPLYKVESLLKLINTSSKETLKELYKNNQTFKTRIESDTLLKNMYDIALRIEGFPRHTSQHAAGIVMCQKDLDEIVPLVKIDNMYLTAYPMEYLEEFGLLKMDFLVIKNLTLIDNIINDIRRIYSIDIDFQKIPLDDKETLKIFENANTCGIFQFESSGMKAFLKKLKPQTLEDIFAAIALFRPGAASNIDLFIKRKHNEEKVEYLDPSLEQITKNTYGILIYQEQIMQLANIYAGYTLAEADILRRAMSKKKLELLKQEEEKFINKSVQMGHDEMEAKKIYDLVLNFAGFGFNKSHSVVYSIIAYKMAYLKCHYNTIFFANLLTNVIGSDIKTNEYIIEAKSNNIEIIKPTINYSEEKYKVVDNKIIFPFSNIKGIGSIVTEQINNAKKDGPFIDIYDCISRLYIAGVNKKTFESLIYAEVFKEFNFNRKTLINNLDSLYNYAELTKDIDPSLVMKPEIEISSDYDKEFLLAKEKEVFGFYLSCHPTTLYKKDNPYCIYLIEVDKYFNKKVDVLVLIEKIKQITTKKGENMAFITGSDETARYEFIVFPKIFRNANLEVGKVVKIRGNVEKRMNELQIIVDKIKYLQGDSNEE